MVNQYFSARNRIELMMAAERKVKMARKTKGDNGQSQENKMVDRGEKE